MRTFKSIIFTCHFDYCAQTWPFCNKSSAETNKKQTASFIENWKITIITLLSHPQIAYKLTEAAGADDILQKKNLYIDGLNNSEDTTIQ